MKRVIFAIHGIRSGKKGNWVFDFIDFAKTDPRFKDDIFEPYTYGFVLATQSILPIFRDLKVKSLKNRLRELINANSGYELNIVAHSYGTILSYLAIKKSGEDGKPPILVNKLILVASVVSRHGEIPYAETLRASKIKEMHCYCSYEDEVCNFAPFGHSGCFGFSKDKYDKKCYPKPFDDLAIYNHQVELVEHCDYFKDAKYYKEWLDIIAAS